MRKRPHKYASRKLIAATLTAGAIMLMGVLAAVFPAVAPQLPAVVGGLVSTLLVYCGGNVASTIAVGKSAVSANLDAEEGS